MVKKYTVFTICVSALVFIELGHPLMTLLFTFFFKLTGTDFAYIFLEKLLDTVVKLLSL